MTIDGVTAVVDSGLARVASHSPWSGLPRLRGAPRIEGLGHAARRARGPHARRGAASGSTPGTTSTRGRSTTCRRSCARTCRRPCSPSPPWASGTSSGSTHPPRPRRRRPSRCFATSARSTRAGPSPRSGGGCSASRSTRAWRGWWWRPMRAAPGRPGRSSPRCSPSGTSANGRRTADGGRLPPAPPTSSSWPTSSRRRRGPVRAGPRCASMRALAGRAPGGGSRPAAARPAPGSRPARGNPPRIRRRRSSSRRSRAIRIAWRGDARRAARRWCSPGAGRPGSTRRAWCARRPSSSPSTPRSGGIGAPSSGRGGSRAAGSRPGGLVGHAGDAPRPLPRRAALGGRSWSGTPRPSASTPSSGCSTSDLVLEESRDAGARSRARVGVSSPRRPRHVVRDASAEEGAIDRLMARLALRGRAAPDERHRRAHRGGRRRRRCARPVRGRRSFAELREAATGLARSSRGSARPARALARAARPGAGHAAGTDAECRCNYEAGEKPPWVESRLQDFFGSAGPGGRLGARAARAPPARAQPARGAGDDRPRRLLGAALPGAAARAHAPLPAPRLAGGSADRSPAGAARETVSAPARRYFAGSFSPMAIMARRASALAFASLTGSWSWTVFRRCFQVA